MRPFQKSPTLTGADHYVKGTAARQVYTAQESGVTLAFGQLLMQAQSGIVPP
jgi:hypothetical protein